MVKKLLGYYTDDLFEEFGLYSVKVLIMALEYDFISSDNFYIKEVVIKALENFEFSFLDSITELIQNSNHKDELVKIFKKEVVYSICMEITNWAIDSYQFDSIYCESELDTSEIESYVEQLLSDLNYGIDFDDAEFDEVINSLDLDAVITNNREIAEDNDRQAEAYNEFTDLNSSGCAIDPIDDLFDR